jgi:hypothetical protein
MTPFDDRPATSAIPATAPPQIDVAAILSDFQHRLSVIEIALTGPENVYTALQAVRDDTATVLDNLNNRLSVVEAQGNATIDATHVEIDRLATAVRSLSALVEQMTPLAHGHDRPAPAHPVGEPDKITHRRDQCLYPAGCTGCVPS